MEVSVVLGDSFRAKKCAQMYQTMRNFPMTDLKPENSDVIHGLQKQIQSLKQVDICCQH